MESKYFHVTAGQLEHFFSGDLEEGEAVKVLRHLLSGCEECRHTFKTVLETTREPEPFDYSDLMRRLDLAAVVALGEIDFEKKHAARIWPNLNRLPPEQRLFIVKHDPLYQTWGIFTAALEDMKVVTLDDPLGALDLAHLAVTIAELLDAKHYGEARLADFKAQAFVALGNTKRILGDFQGAEVALNSAHSLLNAGTGDPYEKANMISVSCSLKADLGYLEDATSILNDAVRHARKIKDRHLAARLTFQQSSYIGFVDPLLGYELADKASRMVDEGESLFLDSASKYLTSYWTNELGDPRLAKTIFESGRELFSQFGDSYWRGRLLHLRGNIARTEGNLRHAEKLYRDLVDLYSVNNFEFDLALV
jgi:tetratricopeptide (TPR) repeat protein